MCMSLLLHHRQANFDLSFEHYLPHGGIVSVGLFDKALRDYIVSRIGSRTFANSSRADSTSSSDRFHGPRKTVAGGCGSGREAQLYGGTASIGPERLAGNACSKVFQGRHLCYKWSCRFHKPQYSICQHIDQWLWGVVSARRIFTRHWQNLLLQG